MILNANNYRIQLPYIKRWLENRPGYNYMKEVGTLALATNIPIIVISHFIGEINGYTPEILSKIERDCKFYNVSEVIGIKNDK